MCFFIIKALAFNWALWYLEDQNSKSFRETYNELFSGPNNLFWKAPLNPFITFQVANNWELSRDLLSNRWYWDTKSNEVRPATDIVYYYGNMLW